eukprot:scaffold38086_cov20-Tisochrysis_lutea.AAC.3
MFPSSSNKEGLYPYTGTACICSKWFLGAQRGKALLPPPPHFKETCGHALVFTAVTETGTRHAHIPAAKQCKAGALQPPGF